MKVSGKLYVPPVSTLVSIEEQAGLQSWPGRGIEDKVFTLCRESNKHRKATHIECQKTRGFSHKFLELSTELKSLHLAWVHTIVRISLRVAISKKLQYWVGSWIGRSHPLPQGGFRSSSG
jgi:hypothetical protein